MPAAPKFSLRRDDACNFVAKFEPESIDLVIFDPAYESLEKHRAKGTTTRLKQSKGSSNQWFPIFPNARFEELFRLLWTALKRNTHLYMFCDQETMFVAKPIAEAAGFKFHKPLVWDKQAIGMGYHYRARYEFILFFEKGKRKLRDLAMPDIITAKRVYKGYPTEKPVAAIEPLVHQSSLPGEVVLDPFSGSGATGVAAVAAGRRFVGCDIAPEAVQLATGRIEAAGGLHVPGYRPLAAQGALF